MLLPPLLDPVLEPVTDIRKPPEDPVLVDPALDPAEAPEPADVPEVTVGLRLQPAARTEATKATRPAV
jgi:hypothetical protein